MHIYSFFRKNAAKSINNRGISWQNKKIFVIFLLLLILIMVNQLWLIEYLKLLMLLVKEK